MKNYIKLAAFMLLTIAGFSQTPGLVNSEGQGVNPVPFKTALGLEQVNNTTDANKPVSTAQATAISTAAAGLAPLPWKMPDCLAAYDYRDVSVTSTKVTQWNDKTGNGWHLTNATDATRGIWSTNGVWLQGGAYTVANGGIPIPNCQTFTAVYIGRDWNSELPGSNISSAGCLFSIGSSRPRMEFSMAYTNTQAGGVDYYGPAPIWSPMGNPTIFALATGTDNTIIYNNGLTWTKLAYSVNTATLQYVFAAGASSQQMWRPTYAVLFFARKLSIPELAQIAHYYGCPVQPAPSTVYAFGSSSLVSQLATTYNQGCVQLFADSIGANRGIWAYGGAGWNGQANGLSTASSIHIPKGTRNIHILMPQTNDLAGHATTAACTAAIDNAISVIKANDPFAWIILAPITPRNYSFTGGQTYDDFDVDRLTVNSHMDSVATATLGIVYTPLPSELADKGDEANTTYFNADKLHMNNAGHLLYSQASLFKSYTSLLGGN